MSQLINIYSDESCHLETNQLTKHNRFMVLGGMSCPNKSVKSIFKKIKEIKAQNNLQMFSEVKWTKVTKNKFNAYKSLVEYFFSCDELSFRSIIIDKQELNLEKFFHSHDQFYYKMYWQMLEWFIDPANRYHIYLDLKDTQGSFKIMKLHDVLCNSQHDFDRQVVEKIQEVRSHEIALLQLTDILIGAVSYANRYPTGGESVAKQQIVNLIKKLSGVTLQHSSSLGARKFNIFRWDGKR